MESDTVSSSTYNANNQEITFENDAEAYDFNGHLWAV